MAEFEPIDARRVGWAKAWNGAPATCSIGYGAVPTLRRGAVATALRATIVV
jgi:hypothetical protein